MQCIRTVGIIGAGISGLACASVLTSAGLDVTVFEKSRGVGGRVATRRLDSGVNFDHGAQYFTVKDDRFARQVNQWCAAGVTAVWDGRIVSIDHGIATELNEARNRYVGVAAMNAMAKSLATGVNVLTGITVESVAGSAGEWTLAAGDGASHGPFDLLVSTAPPLQSARLVGGLSSMMREEIDRVTMLPCWAVLLQLAEQVEVSFDGAFVQNSPLSWVARNSSKPGRGGDECWVLHASAGWSQEHLEDSAESVAQSLVAAWWEAIGQPPRRAIVSTAHRWRYALPDQPLPASFLLDDQLGLAACGDWCGGPRVEGAYLSGLSLAEAILARQ